MAPVGDLRVTTCRSLEEAASHLDAWSVLAADASAGRAFGEWFAGPLWLLPLLDSYFRDRQLALSFIYECGELTGMVPLVCGATSGSQCKPTLSSPANSHVRRIGILSRHTPTHTLTQFFNATFSGKGSVTRARCVALRQIPRDSDLFSGLHAAAAQCRLVTNTFEETSSAIVEVPNGWEAYAATRTSEQLHPLRKRRRMEKAGGWEFRAAHAVDDFEATWDRLLEIERRSWKHIEGTSIENEPGANGFYRAVAFENARAGTLRVHFLEHRGSPVAHTLGVVHGGTYYLLKHSFDEAHRPLSPGLQLLWHAFEDTVVQDGCIRLDLLGDSMSWKIAMGTSFPAYVSCMVFPRGNLRCQGCKLTNETLKPVGRKLGVKNVIRRLGGNAR